MAIITQETRFDLTKHEAVTLTAARDHLLRCDSGELWITVEGDRRDHILGPGDRLRVDRDVPVIVSALKDSVLQACHRTPFGARTMGRARSVLVSLLNWEFPPLASFPSTMIR